MFACLRFLVYLSLWVLAPGGALAYDENPQQAVSALERGDWQTSRPPLRWGPALALGLPTQNPCVALQRMADVPRPVFTVPGPGDLDSPGKERFKGTPWAMKNPIPPAKIERRGFSPSVPQAGQGLAQTPAQEAPIPIRTALMDSSVAVPRRIREGSLWKSARNSQRNLTANRTAYQLGDLLTVKIEQTLTFNNKLQKDYHRDANVNESLNQFIFSPASSHALTKKGQLPKMGFNGTQDRKTSGTLNDNRTLGGQIVARVTSIDHRGNLFIEGRQYLKYAGESQYGILTGIIKPTDIGADNSISSQRIADLAVEFVAEGDTENQRRKGWFSQLYDIVSPF